MFCAAALLCGASLAHAQGFAGSTATGQPVTGFYGNQGYHVSQVAYSPEYAAYVQQAQHQASMPGYAGTGFPGASPGYGYGYGYGYNPYAYGFTPAQAMLPATPSIPMAVPPADSGVPIMEGAPLEAATGDVVPGKQDRFWINAAYTMTWVQPQKLLYPLVTFGASTDQNPGALGQPGTTVAVGDSLDHNHMDGIRIDAGVFLDSARVYSLEWVGNLYAPSSLTITRQSDINGIPVIARPFQNVVTGESGAFFDATPGALAGGVTVDSKTSLAQTEFNLGCNGCGGNWSGAWLFGLRFLRLSESLTITDRVDPLLDNFILFNGAGVAATDFVVDFDSFRTRNTFYGGQVGGRFRWDGSWVFVSGYGKFGLGVTEQNVEINGLSTLIQANGATQSLPGGILALPSNIGSYSRTVFSFSPEVGLNLGLKLTQHLAVSAGYSFTYWSHVVRPGRQIDPNINPSQVPTDNSFGATTGPTRPAFVFNDEDIYYHTLSLGLNIQY
jgi:hypothetical protein